MVITKTLKVIIVLTNQINQLQITKNKAKKVVIKIIQKTHHNKMIKIQQVNKVKLKIVKKKKQIKMEHQVRVVVMQIRRLTIKMNSQIMMVMMKVERANRLLTKIQQVNKVKLKIVKKKNQNKMEHQVRVVVMQIRRLTIKMNNQIMMVIRPVNRNKLKKHQVNKVKHKMSKHLLNKKRLKKTKHKNKKFQTIKNKLKKLQLIKKQKKKLIFLMLNVKIYSV